MKISRYHPIPPKKHNNKSNFSFLKLHGNIWEPDASNSVWFPNKENANEEFVVFFRDRPLVDFDLKTFVRISKPFVVGECPHNMGMRILI